MRKKKNQKNISDACQCGLAKWVLPFHRLVAETILEQPNHFCCLLRMQRSKWNHFRRPIERIIYVLDDIFVEGSCTRLSSFPFCYDSIVFGIVVQFTFESVLWAPTTMHMSEKRNYSFGHFSRTLFGFSPHWRPIRRWNLHLTGKKWLSRQEYACTTGCILVSSTIRCTPLTFYY